MCWSIISSIQSLPDTSGHNKDNQGVVEQKTEITSENVIMRFTDGPRILDQDPVCRQVVESEWAVRHVDDDVSSYLTTYLVSRPKIGGMMERRIKSKRGATMAKTLLSHLESSGFCIQRRQGIEDERLPAITHRGIALLVLPEAIH